MSDPTKPTTAECVAWLDMAKKHFQTKTSQGMAMGTDDYDAIEGIRAKLLVASEIAKALETSKQLALEVQAAQSRGAAWYTKGEQGLYQQVRMWVGKANDHIDKALVDWKAAGGE